MVYPTECNNVTPVNKWLTFLSAYRSMYENQSHISRICPQSPVASLRQYYKWYLIKDHWGSNLNRTWHGEPSLKAAVSFLEALVFEDIETQLFFCTSLGLSGKELMQRMCRETSSTLLLSSSVQCCGLCTSHDMLWTKSLCISYGQFIYWLVLLNISLWRK